MNGGTARPVIVAQITDLHLGFVADDPDEPNRLRLNAVLAQLAAMNPAPDHLVVSGDLTEHGTPAAYAAVKSALALAPCPFSIMAGNHDRRMPLAAAFPDAIDAGFVQTVVEVGGLRLLLLDTLDQTRHAGMFCEMRATWLSARLRERPDAPTIVFLHHPPVAVGIDWMDPNPADPWIARLSAAISGQRQVVALACGHLHRPIATHWRGLPVTVCPSTSPELALELAPVDPCHTDDRPLIVAGEPGYALHRWYGGTLVSHFVRLGGEVIARFTPELQPMIAGMVAERVGGSPAQPRRELLDLGKAK